MKKIIGTLEARMPNGASARIYEVQEQANAITGDGQGSDIKRFELADGRRLTMVGRGEFKVEGTNEVFLVTAPQ